MTYLIHHFLEHSADRHPEKEAFVHGPFRLTYLEIEERSNAIANWLLCKRVKKLARIALLLRNSAEYVYAYYGVLKAGCIVVPLNTGLDSDEIRQMVEDAEPHALITEQHFAKTINRIYDCQNCILKILVVAGEGNKLTGEWRWDYISFNQIFNQYSGSRPDLSLIYNEPASIIYTSGSTGRPKGAVLSHKNVVSNTYSIIKYLQLNKNDRCMVVMPFYYVYGKSLLNTHFSVSGSVVIDNRFSFPNAVLKNMIDEKVTGFAGVPSTYSILLNRSSLRKFNFPNLRYLTQAGGHMPSQVKKELLEIFRDKDIFIMFGATEASARLSYLEPDELNRRTKSIGKPIPGVQMKVFTQDGSEALCGEEGEIVAKGSNIMLGYWKDPEESNKVLKKGWYYTGDLGYKDNEGFFYITGRKRDMIKVGTNKVSATEIEEVLYKHPKINEAAVIGFPDDILGEAIRAFIVMEEDSSFDPDNIREFCANGLPDYKVPKEIIFVKYLPKNDAGKILKKRLLEIRQK